MDLNPVRVIKDTSHKLPSLDGWRAASILLVLAHHSKFMSGYPAWLRPSGYFNGIFGVRCFFVISGFLITYLLHREYCQKGRISLRNFYVRRSLRILPVYFTFLLVALALQIFTPWHQTGTDWLSNLTFTTDFVERQWTDSNEVTTGHLWSLAVEEQFYLVWPIVLSLIGSKQRGRTVYWVLGILIILTPIFRTMRYKDAVPAMLVPLFQAFSSPFYYFDSLAIGCVAAIFFARNEQAISATMNRFKWGSVFLGLALILEPLLVSHWWLGRAVSVPLGQTFQATGFSILLIQSILSPAIFMPLNWPVIRTLGVLSYSIYIWQQIFCTNPKCFGLGQVWFMSFPGWLLAALLMALVSYYCLEKPLMGLRARFRKAD